ncbi:MAG: hypothetical protein LE178_05415, partial [Endomicrobium sp.]|nr:hypothetical protein [Endomicrobium sp.]
MFIRNQICKGKRDIFKTISQRRSFNEWNDFKAIEFQRYNETERLILYFRLYLGILNRKEISTRTGIPEYQVERFVKVIRTYEYENPKT